MRSFACVEVLSALPVTLKLAGKLHRTLAFGLLELEPKAVVMRADIRAIFKVNAFLSTSTEFLSDDMDLKTSPVATSAAMASSKVPKL